MFKRVGTSLEKGERKENQDAILVRAYLAEESKQRDAEDALILGVLDGHGSSGRACANVTRDLFEKALLAKDNKIVASALKNLEESNPELRTSLEDLFEAIQKDIETYSEQKQDGVNARFSGTTVVLTIVTEKCIAVANVGDSDCVLGTRKDGKLEATLMNSRHQLHVEEEKLRVEQAGGRVEAQRTRDGAQMIGPLRVWLKEIQTPGLMVSRSIGDTVCHDIGVCSNPHIHCHRRTKDDLLVILGSDGLWEFVDYAEAVHFVDDFLDSGAAAHALAKMALSRQSVKTADNVSVIVLFLEDDQDRKNRLEADPEFEERRQRRLAQIVEFDDRIEQIRLGKADVVSGPHVPGEPLGGTSGSILYGEVNVVHGSIVASESAKPDDSPLPPTRSKLCTIS
mmetsp:Transcript_9889/g.25012  ORF Transcript_9889/g.25012 Transcript_9889/m.25012 type:complete len:397 (+) Transcript_9889:298-1488(+)